VRDTADAAYEAHARRLTKAVRRRRRVMGGRAVEREREAHGAADVRSAAHCGVAPGSLVASEARSAQSARSPEAENGRGRTRDLSTVLVLGLTARTPRQAQGRTYWSRPRSMVVRDRAPSAAASSRKRAAAGYSVFWDAGWTRCSPPSAMSAMSGSSF